MFCDAMISGKRAKLSVFVVLSALALCRPVPAPALAPDASVRAASSRHTLVIQPAASRGPVLDMINGAGNSLDLVSYEMDDAELIKALLAAVEKGVRVRAIFDVRSKHFIPNPNPATMKTLAAGGAAVREASRALFPITHQKTLIADDSRALVMSFNLCPGYFGGTRDFGILTTDPVEVSEIAGAFEADWNGRPLRRPDSPLVWSPDNARRKLEEMINSAAATLDIYTLEIKDAGILAALRSAAQRGVRVRVLAARLMQNGKDVNAAAAAALKEAGALVKSLDELFVHGKMMLADYGSDSARAYVGSQNFSVYSLDRNRELGIISVNPAVLRGLNDAFESDWKSIR